MFVALAALALAVFITFRRKRTTSATLRSRVAPAAPRAPPPPPSSFGASLSGKRALLFVDVETTGFGYADRIVGIGAVKLDLRPPGEIRTLNLVFNPERRCSKGAVAAHGWDNKTLKRQDVIMPYANPLRAWFAEADLIVAHNVAFDLRFLNAMFEANGAPELAIPSECTMLAYRARGEGSAALDAIIARLGLPARSHHSALQDAWLCMQVFCWLRGLPWRLDFSLAGDLQPANYRPEPPKRKRGRPRKTLVAEPEIHEAATAPS